MRRIAGTFALLFLLLAIPATAQAPANQSFVGTVSAFKSGTQFEFKPDQGVPVEVAITADTLAQKVAPGETSLKNAVAANLADLMIGDRALVTLEAGTNKARRIVIMTASDISKRDDSDRQDWNTRGLSGIVAERSGNTITIRSQSLQGENRQTITVSDQTKFRRYAADSVRFADAKPSRLAEIGTGDQLRARGQKSPDGNTVAAEEVVFGSFLTTAGSVVSVNAVTKEISVRETGSGKAMIVQLTPDSRIKRMAPLPFLPGGGPAAPPGRGGPPAGAPLGLPAPGGANGGMPPGMPPGRGGPPTLAQMVDTFQAGAFDDIKPGQTIVVSSTKGAKTDRVTAILLLTNADMLIRMASMRAGGPQDSAGPAPGIQPGGMPGGMDIGGMLGGFGLSGIGP